MPDYTILARLKIDTSTVDSQLKSKTYNLKANTNPEAVTKMKNATDGLSKSIGGAISKMALWAVAGTMLYGSLRQIEDGIKYVEDLNKVMTNIQMVTGDTAEGIQKLAKDYNDLAMATGTETLAVAEGSLEWARQGKTIEETSQLIKDSMMMSKLANMDSAQATEYLTSIMNGFKLEAGDMIGVLDKLTAIDNSSATSVAELASAMQRSSVSAQLAGVTLEELASYVGTVSSVSRKSAESIGESFKTIFARMQSVKAGADLDEFGDNLNNVEKTLKSFNIELRDSPNHFKDLDVVLSEVAGKWDTLENTEKSEIATAIAGVRQRENFLILMENWNQVLANQTTEAKAAGLATERYGIYMESIEAKMNQFKTAWQDMWSDAVSSDAIKDIVDFGTKIIELIDKMGGIVPVLKGVVTLLVLFNSQLIISKITSMYGGIQSLVAAFFGLGEQLTSTTIATTAEIEATNAATLATNRYSAAAKSAAASSNMWMLAIMLVIQAISEFKKISDINKSGAQTAGEIAATNLSGKTATSDVEYTGTAMMRAINNNKDSNAGSTERYLAQVAVFKEVNKSLQETTGSYEEYKKALDAVAKSAGFFIDEDGKYWATVDNHLVAVDSLTQAEYNQNNVLAQTGESLSDARDAFGEAKDGSEAYVEAETAAEEETAALQETIDTLTSSMDALSAATEEQNKNGEISNQTAIKLVAANADLNQFLTQTATGYQLDTAAALEYIKAQLAAQLTSIGLTNALALVTAGHYADAIAAVADSNATQEAKDAAIALIQSYEQLSASMISSAAASGVATSATNEQKEAYEAEIAGLNKSKDACNKKIDALEKLKDAYADIIDAKKESLRLDKEEADYQKGLDAKNKELADIDKELLQLQFDNSEEANAKRLELENERAEKAADIEEYQADRTYDIQVEALEKEQEAYEKMIDAQIAALEKMISKYDVLIAKINEMIDALGRVPSGGGSGGGTPATPTKTPTTTDTSKLKQSASTGTYINRDRTPSTAFASGGAFSVSSNAINDSGIVRVDANEVGAVLNKQQQSAAAPLAGLFYSIMRGAGQSPNMLSTGGLGTGNNGVSVNIGDIVVQGNLDKVTLADVKDAALKSVVTALKEAGIARSATKFSI